MHISACRLLYDLALTRFSTEELIATVQAATEADVDKAVKAAKAAFKTWKDHEGSERGKLLYKLADLIEAKRELFATVDAWDNGMYLVHIPPTRLPC